MKRTPLKRKTPMRRNLPATTEFASLRQRPVLILPENPPPPRVITMRYTFRPQPKHEYIRSPKLMQAYRTIACQHCQRMGDDAGVCGAHSNWAPHNKGLGVKADDTRCASLCWRCHSMVDQGGALNEIEKKLLWWAAHVRTVCLLWRVGRWPNELPRPDVSVCPWRQ